MMHLLTNNGKHSLVSDFANYFISGLKKNCSRSHLIYLLVFGALKSVTYLQPTGC